mmetsp:Transcript_4741/g.10469  ORF Transcript_4741/g.10469 Transcript_4741/m.10469 type:complete len:124 (-) Transcript_4741:89-460(-)
MGQAQPAHLRLGHGEARPGRACYECTSSLREVHGIELGSSQSAVNGNRHVNDQNRHFHCQNSCQIRLVNYENSLVNYQHSLLNFQNGHANCQKSRVYFRPLVVWNKTLKHALCLSYTHEETKK